MACNRTGITVEELSPAGAGPSASFADSACARKPAGLGRPPHVITRPQEQLTVTRQRQNSQYPRGTLMTQGCLCPQQRQRESAPAAARSRASDEGWRRNAAAHALSERPLIPCKPWPCVRSVGRAHQPATGRATDPHMWLMSVAPPPRYAFPTERHQRAEKGTESAAPTWPLPRWPRLIHCQRPGRQQPPKAGYRKGHLENSQMHTR
jgi:hypothetical protein